MVLSGYMANNIAFGIVVAIFVSLMNMIFNHKHFSVLDGCITLAGTMYIAIPFYPSLCHPASGLLYPLLAEVLSSRGKSS